MAVNNTSVYVAAQQAVLGFAELPADAPRTFMYTGNILNIKPLTQFLESGTGKAASAHMMMAAAHEYKDKGYKYVSLFSSSPLGFQVVYTNFLKILLR
jgi:hypothetical protein